MTSERKNSHARLLNILLSKYSESLILVDGKDLKHVVIDPDTLPFSALADEHHLLAAIPALPPGDWNRGYVHRDEEDNTIKFRHLGHESFERVSTIWHDVSIDFSELSLRRTLQSDIRLVTHPAFPSPVILKYAAFPWHVHRTETETKAYKSIDGTGIGPKFLGHVTEGPEKRVFGFLMEFIEVADDERAADLPACQAALSKLHALGLKHGDTSRGNFLLRGEEVVIIDFERTEPAGQDDLEREVEQLKEEFVNPHFSSSDSNPDDITMGV